MQTVRNEGFMALYKGFFPQWARYAPYGVLQFMVWEQLSHWAGTTTV